MNIWFFLWSQIVKPFLFLFVAIVVEMYVHSLFCNWTYKASQKKAELQGFREQMDKSKNMIDKLLVEVELTRQLISRREDA